MLGNLSTDQIAVDVSGLLHSEQQILNTDREPCFLDEVCIIIDYSLSVIEKPWKI